MNFLLSSVAASKHPLYCLYFLSCWFDLVPELSSLRSVKEDCELGCGLEEPVLSF